MGDTGDDEGRLPDRAAIEAVLSWEPVLRRPATELFTWEPSRRREDDVITMPYVRYAPEVLGFLRALSTNGFIVPFEWPAWADEGMAIQRDPERMARADLWTIVRLFTFHVRADRFTEGHLAEAIEQGWLLALLERLRDLWPLGSAATHHGAMDRAEWLKERRAAVEADYTRDAPTYDDGYDPATPTHRRFVDRLIATTPEGGTLLDAACGTGPYFGIVLAAGRRVVGADQSAGMLARAGEKHPDVPLEHVGLQELSFDGEFDAAMVVDAMEHVPPEAWPLVLENLRRAVRPGGHLYLTVEQVDPRELAAAFDEATTAGLPVVFGEDVGEQTGGYHHYPSRAQVREWLDAASLRVVAEEDEWLDGYGYHHLLLRALEGT